MQGHWSDCAVNNEPADKAGPCDCGGLDLPEDAFHVPVIPRISRARRIADVISQMHREGLIQGHQLPPDWFSTDTPTKKKKNPHTGIVGSRNTNGMNFDDTAEAIVAKLKANTALPGGDG